MWREGNCRDSTDTAHSICHLSNPLLPFIHPCPCLWVRYHHHSENISCVIRLCLSQCYTSISNWNGMWTLSLPKYFSEQFWTLFSRQSSCVKVWQGKKLKPLTTCILPTGCFAIFCNFLRRATFLQTDTSAGKWAGGSQADTPRQAGVDPAHYPGPPKICASPV